MYIDTHAHVNFNAFKDDSDEVIRRSLNEGIAMILVGAEYKTSKRALEIANRYEKNIYAAIGLHPIHLREGKIETSDGREVITRAEEFSYDAYEKLAQFNKAIAIGEIGLDYYRLDFNEDIAAIKQEQKRVFWEQLKLAVNLKLPVIIHCRQAHDDVLEILTKFKKDYKESLPKDRPWGVMHCFSGDENLAWQYFNLGLLISFTGIITFSKQWDDLIRKIPMDKFMLETDCPYLTPEPFRGQRNEPILVRYVAQRIAEIKYLSIEAVAERTLKNAQELFRI